MTKKTSPTKPAAKSHPVVVRAKVHLDWLQSIVDRHLSGKTDGDVFHADMRAAWDAIAADGLTDEVCALWRVQTYGSR